jgi:hypothetical protein
MDPILDKARAGQNLLERMMNKIPGFKGYREKELRRDADGLQRDHLAGKLDACKKPLNDVSAAASRSGSLDVMNDIETARKRLDKVVNRIRYADRGYAGFFAAIKVEEAALARVYEFDLDLLRGVDAVGSAAQALAKPDADLKGTLQRMISEIDGLDARMADREAILGGFS